VDEGSAGLDTLDTGSSNETCRTGSGLGTDSVFSSSTPADRGGARGCTRGMYRCRFSVISGGPLRTEGTSHVAERTATLYIHGSKLGDLTQKAKKGTNRHETRASCNKCEKHHDRCMGQSAHRIRPLCEVECDTEPNVDIKAPPAGIDQIITTGGGPLLCATLDRLGGSQGSDLPC
jgi:hypothetical protein